jgi:hypothetical protein
MLCTPNSALVDRVDFATSQLLSSRLATGLSALAPAQRAGAQRLCALALTDDSEMSAVTVAIRGKAEKICSLGVLQPLTLRVDIGMSAFPLLRRLTGHPAWVLCPTPYSEGRFGPSEAGQIARLFQLCCFAKNLNAALARHMARKRH